MPYLRLVTRIVIFASIVGTVAGGLGWFPAAAQSAPLASLDPVSGLVQYQTAHDDPQDPAAWQTLSGPVLAGEGDRIRTDSAGLAYLTFFEGIQTEIRANTLVVVSTLVLAAEDPLNVSLDVLVGTTFTTIDAALGPNDRFEIHTPGATAAVRGTRWWTFVEPNGDATFATEAGRVDIFLHRFLAAAPAVGEAPDVAAGEAPAEDSAPEGAAPPAAAARPRAAASVGAGGFVGVSRAGTRLADARVTTLPSRERLPIRKLAPASCGDGVCRPVERRLCPVDCVNRAELTACGDGVCDPDAGESLLVCGTDCGPFAGESCGDGSCDADESGLTCPADCSADQYFSPVNTALCGNGVCDPTESALRCPADCR